MCRQTPIAIIKAFANTLSRPDSVWDQETIKDKLRKIEEESDRLAEMVKGLMQAFRADAGELVVNRLQIDLLSEVAKVVTRFSDQTHQDFKIRIAQDVPPVMADPEKLEEVLTNLIGNAIKFSLDTGHLRPYAGKKIEPAEILIKALCLFRFLCPHYHRHRIRNRVIKSAENKILNRRVKGVAPLFML